MAEANIRAADGTTCGNNKVRIHKSSRILVRGAQAQNQRGPQLEYLPGTATPFQAFSVLGVLGVLGLFFIYLPRFREEKSLLFVPFILVSMQFS